MWYVIQVQGGQEEKTAELIKKQLTLREDSLRECFIPKKERVKKFKGSWQHVEEILFPGYVFADSGNAEELYSRLKQVGRLTKVLQDGNFLFLALSEDEERWIKAIGDRDHVTRVSKINIEPVRDRISRNANSCSLDNGQKIVKENYPKTHRSDEPDIRSGIGKKVIVQEGPLKGLEGCVEKINLHKREVTIRMPFAGRMVDVKLGIEVVGKE